MTTVQSTHVSDEDALAAALHELRLSDDAAGLRAFIHLCRRSGRVRQWVASRLGSKETKREFTAFLQGRGKGAGLWGAAVGEEVVSDPADNPESNGPYGGLSEVQVWRLIKATQGGDADAALFLVTQTWQAALAEGRPVPAALWLTTLECWHRMVADRSAKKAEAFVKMLKFLDGRSTPAGDSWKTHLLLYILRHPQPHYRVGELHAQLPANYREERNDKNPHAALREVRKFCAECGIRRDTRAGAPRKRNAQ